MILTLTPNPSVDRTVSLGAPLVPGTVHRITAASSQSGGKGVNISRAAVAAGVPTVAVLPAPPDDAYVLELQHEGIDCRPEPTAGDIRVNLTVTDPAGTTTKLNSAGPPMTAELLDRMRQSLVGLATAADWVVLAGSLPPGCPDGWYADLVVAVRPTGARVAVDTSDAPLTALVERLDGTGAPHLMKPNGHELASLSGADADTLEADPAKAAAAAQDLLDRGVREVLVTLGGNGAVLVTGTGAWHATPPPTTVASTVGAGDCSLFGYLLADHRGIGDPGARLALAVAYGSAAAGLPGTTIPTPSQTRPELVRVHAL